VNKMDIRTISFKRRSLPHWEVAGKMHFVTFRLRNTLPKEIVVKFQKRRSEILAEDNVCKIHEFQRYEFKEIERILDSVKNDENAYLSRFDIAPVLMEAFESLEYKYCWSFPSYVIMPNHIHCLCVADKEGKGISLTDIIGLYKRFTSRKINTIRGESGRIWIDENFDHWCRDHHKVESIVKYIENNPVKAGLVDKSENWRWKK